jgi:hypothetical protein
MAGADVYRRSPQSKASGMTYRRAVADAMAMKTVKSTIMPWPELAE